MFGEIVLTYVSNQVLNLSSAQEHLFLSEWYESPHFINTHT